MTPPAAEIFQQAQAQWRAGRLEAALALFDQALALAPRDPHALNSRATLLRILGKPHEALAGFDQVLAVAPQAAGALCSRGETLLALGRPREALADFDRAAALKPDLADACLGLGRALAMLHRLPEAAARFDQALALDPDCVEAHFQRGLVLDALGHALLALESYDRAIALQPWSPGAINNRSVVLQKLRRYGEAAQGYETLLASGQPQAHALDGLANCALQTCDWSRAEEFADRLRAHVLDGTSEIQPGTLIGYTDDAALQLACARRFLAGKLPPAAAPLWRGRPFSADRIRLAYCSADFHDHATARLMAGLFERHDRSRFEVIAISYGPDDASPMRARLVKAFDQFHDVARQDDGAIADRIAGLGVDIAVDLKGHTAGGRIGILAARPAPVQVNYMGFAGTLGTDFHDYILADAIVAPMARQECFSERLVHLPDCYFVNDDRYDRPGPPPPRALAGLPEQGFVFCCFNNNWKITAPLFDIWMRLLDAVPGSVLWLLQDNDEAAANLRRHAAARGVAPDRLVFAPRVSPAAHLARHQLADLFVDTLPYNAHTTACDSLWAGVPLVTCPGGSLHSRVAASVLHALGLPELVTATLADYETLALALARDPARLAALRARIAANRATYPLFDTARSARAFEAAYLTMRDIWTGDPLTGGAPRGFRVGD